MIVLEYQGFPRIPNDMGKLLSEKCSMKKMISKVLIVIWHTTVGYI